MATFVVVKNTARALVGFLVLSGIYLVACVGDAPVLSSPAPEASSGLDAGSDPPSSEDAVAPAAACTVGTMRSCPEYAFPDAKVGETMCDGKPCTARCSKGIETCVESPNGSANVWGACAGAVAPAAADLCVLGNDDNCNGIPNEGCSCTDGDTGTCDLKIGLKGPCGAGTAVCNRNTYTCTVAPQPHDTCDSPTDDGTCNGIPNEGCACVKGGAGSTAPCGLCSLGTKTCTGGASPSGYGACVEAPGACVAGTSQACTSCAPHFKGTHTCSAACAYPTTCAVSNSTVYTGLAADFTHACGRASGTAWNGNSDYVGPCTFQGGNDTQLPPGNYSVTYSYSYSCTKGNGFAAVGRFKVIESGVEVAASSQLSPTSLGTMTGTKTFPFTVSAADGCNAAKLYEFNVVYDPDTEGVNMGCAMTLNSTVVTFLSP